MELQVNILGIILIILALIHVVFPSYFNWKEELNSLSLVNKEIMYVHTFFVALMVFLMGVLCVTAGEELVYTAFGKKIALGLGIFWLFRLLIQFLGYSSELWKGKRFETMIHIIFSILWAYSSLLFLWIYWK